MLLWIGLLNYLLVSISFYLVDLICSSSEQLDVFSTVGNASLRNRQRFGELKMGPKYVSGTT